MLGPMTESIETFQIPIEAAECYEAEFVPAFFAQWAPILCAAAGVTGGQTVLDVGCGTGIVARTAADLVGPAGSVTGLDLNEAMLTVARRVRPDARLAPRRRRRPAVRRSDLRRRAVSQMALMFVPDRAAALREMGRVVKRGRHRRPCSSRASSNDRSRSRRSSIWSPAMPVPRRCRC